MVWMGAGGVVMRVGIEWLRNDGIIGRVGMRPETAWLGEAKKETSSSSSSATLPAQMPG